MMNTLSFNSYLRSLLLALAGFLFAHSGQAQQQSASSNAMQRAVTEHAILHPEAAPPDTTRRPFDVLSYDVFLDWRQPFLTHRSLFNGWSTITMAVTSATDSIVLDATQMHIDTCWLNNVLIPPPQPIAEQISIPLPVSLRNASQPVTLRFAYHRTLDSNDGFYFYPKGTISTLGNQTDTNTEDVAYTMSEPYDAHKWMPCLDLPYDKAASKISIQVPAGYTAQSNGNELAETLVPSDNSTIYSWQSDKPIVTYLMVANASKWRVWRDYYHRVSNPSDSVPVIYYSWQSDYDSAASRFHALNAYAKTPRMIATFSSLYGEYPYVKYAQVPVDPFAFGGMEHQTITTIHRRWLEGNSENGIAHELMHQWFGDKTTCETFADIWLNEGFATFGEAIWDGAEYGYPAYQNQIAWQSHSYFNDPPNALPVYNPPIDLVFNFATVYEKASCVIDMLRHYIANDTLFFNSLRDYSNAFAFTTATTAEFEHFMSNRLGVDLSEFMDSWIYGPGHPIYDITWGQRTNGSVNVLVNQTQTVRDHFTMPMAFQVFHGSAIDTFIVRDNQRSQLFYLPEFAHADSVKFDSSSVVVSLHTMNEDARLAVAAMPAQTGLQVHQSDGRLVCDYAPAQETRKIELVDLLGSVVMSETIAAASSRISFTAPSNAGVYFVRINSSDSAPIIAKVLVLR